MSLIKYIETGTEFFDTGEQTVVPLVPYAVTDVQLTKQASEVSDFIRSLKAKPENLYLLINALGASDYWGMNANGDVFSENQLLDSHKTFEEFGNFYKHHLNKPSIGHKKYGKVLFAYYNPAMHRVELITEVWKKDAPDIVEDIADGKDVAVSMAIKVPYDTCTIRGCGNVAKTRGQYCEHGKSMLTKLLDDGQQVGRINPNGKFFDISKVFRPADRTGYVLRKVASTGYVIPSAELAEVYQIRDPWPEASQRRVAPSIAYTEKLASVSKLAAIEKQIEAAISGEGSARLNEILEAAKEAAPELTKSEIDGSVKEAPGVAILKKIHRLRGDVSFPEFVRMMLPGREYADQVIMFSPQVRNGFSLLEERPELLESMPSLMESYGSAQLPSELGYCFACLSKKASYPTSLSEVSFIKSASRSTLRTISSAEPDLGDLLGMLESEDRSKADELKALLTKYDSSRELAKVACDLGVAYYVMKLNNPLYKEASTRNGGVAFHDANGNMDLPMCVLGFDFVANPGVDFLGAS